MRWAGNLLAAALGAGLALLAAEAGTRLLWDDAPAAAGAADTLPVRQIRDPEILYRLVPGSSGQYNGTPVQVNSSGLRDRDYAIPAPDGTQRILVLGDSMTFGVGLAPAQTLPGQLARVLAPAEVINAGVFGYNLPQEISLLRDVGLRYRPGIVVSCFVHNDIENWGLGLGGGVPELKSSRFEPPSDDTWSARLATFMVPGAFDQDRLNLLPAAGSGGLRHGLASWSRLYLFVYLRLRTHGWNLTGGEVRDPILAAPTCQAERVIWEPLRQRYRQLRAMIEESGARLVVVIQGGLLWEGWPLARLHQLLSEEGIAFLDLTPVWLDRDFYAREYTLGWDPHPNERANALAAELIASFLRQGGGGPHDVIAARPELAERLARWSERQRALLDAGRAGRPMPEGQLAPSIDFSGGQEGGSQVLYGFWDAGNGPPAAGQGRWISWDAAVTLARPAAAEKVMIEVVMPRQPEALQATPDTLDVTIGTPPGGCDAARLELPVEGEPGQLVRLEAPLPPALAGGAVEVGLRSGRPYPATHLAAGRDPRLVSWLVRRIALE